MKSNLRPFDIPVLLYVCIHPGESYGRMAAVLGLSKSTAHGSVVRLQRSGLVHAAMEGKRLEASFAAAMDLLLKGVPYVFPAETVPKARGVLTGLAAAGDANAELVDAEIMVWPSRLGETVGVGVRPLIASAPDIAMRDRDVYRLLALVDALRVGNIREREVAERALRATLEEAMHLWR